MENYIKRCIVCNIELVKKCNESKKYFETKKTCSRTCFHKQHGEKAKLWLNTPESHKKIGLAHRNKIVTDETKRKVRDTKLRNGTDLFGAKNPRWNGGKLMDKDGYYQVKISTTKYKREHRKIMEDYLKRNLKNEEIIHHINGIKIDNRLENLQILTRSEHVRIHQGIKNI